MSLLVERKEGRLEQIISVFLEVMVDLVFIYRKANLMGEDCFTEQPWQQWGDLQYSSWQFCVEEQFYCCLSIV